MLSLVFSQMLLRVAQTLSCDRQHVHLGRRCLLHQPHLTLLRLEAAGSLSAD